MNRFTKTFKRLKKIITPVKAVGLVVVLAIIAWVVFSPEDLSPRHTVDRGVVERVVIASGKVEVSDQVDLAFQQSGTVAQVAVSTGDKVKKGQLIAQLDLGTLSADLRDAKAGLTEARYKKSKSQLDSSLKTGVLNTDASNNAATMEALRIKLLSADLELSPKDSGTASSSVSIPRVTGTYRGAGEKAVFNISLYSSGGVSGLSARITGQGITETVSLSTTHASPIGNTGLLLTLPQDISSLSGSDWVLELPNTKSAQYVSNLYQFLDAKKNYENALKTQQNEISLINKGYDGYTEYDIAIERAQAAIDRVQQSIRLRGIYAPVSGSIGRIDLRVGQAVTQGAGVVTVLGQGGFQTKLRVPESSIGGIQLDDPVLVVPDTDASEMYKGTISTIDQSETYLEGTPVYETTVLIENSADLKPGMTVRGKITTDKKLDVIRVPDLALFDNADKSGFVIKALVDPAKNITTDVPVVVGLRGTDGFVAITGSVAVGDIIQLQKDVE